MILDKKVSSRRNTRQRVALLDLLTSVTCHPDAFWLHGKLQSDWPLMSLGTVYRNLAVLASEGKVRVLRLDGEMDRFDGDTSVHYHVICTNCGSIADVPASSFGPVDCDETAAQATGYEISGHSMDFFGVCPECRKGF